ncbi:lysine N(6)-hydroxylase/L-ornithine N(5)-oxygenase family protein [Flindersiella endophytica]
MTEPYDLVGVGIGPFNLSLAALASGVDGLRARFYDAKPEWSWHPGLLFDEAKLQVPFLADLVTLVDPTSRWSFLSYLREHDRLFPFYFSERFHAPRREYDHYCGWVSRQLPACVFGSAVESVEWDSGLFVVRSSNETVRARNVVLGLGTEPVVPSCFAPVLGERVLPAADYLFRRDSLRSLGDVTVIGSGQTGAEVFLDLLRSAVAAGSAGQRLRWLTRSPAFAPMEYSKLGLEHFTPEYTRYFHGLPAATRDALFPRQWQLYKAISDETISEIHDLLYDSTVGGGWPDVQLMPNVEVVSAAVGADADLEGVELGCRHVEQERSFGLRTDAVVLATGYRQRHPAVLDPLKPLVRWDDRGRFQVGADYRVSAALPGGGLYVQNAETHTHGVGAPDLGLGAYRAAVILNSVCDRTVYRLPARTAFTTFGVPPEEDLHVAARPR